MRAFAPRNYFLTRFRRGSHRGVTVLMLLGVSFHTGVSNIARVRGVLFAFRKGNLSLRLHYVKRVVAPCVAVITRMSDPLWFVLLPIAYSVNKEKDLSLQGSLTIAAWTNPQRRHSLERNVPLMAAFFHVPFFDYTLSPSPGRSHPLPAELVIYRHRRHITFP